MQVKTQKHEIQISVLLFSRPLESFVEKKSKLIAKLRFGEYVRCSSFMLSLTCTLAQIIESFLHVS